VTGSKIRRAAPEDLKALAAFIAQSNAEPARQCLHTPGNRPRVIREALLREGGLAEDSGSVFILAADGYSANGGISGAIGCQFGPAGDTGWLWGPWISAPPGWKTQAPPLLEELLRALPAGVGRLDAFLNIANRDGLDFLQYDGFAIRAPTHIYVAPAPAMPSGTPLPELGVRHEVGFARLHREMFPAAESTPAEELLAGRDDEHVIFAAADDLRLLGYVCVSVNAAPREGFIEYLAVRPSGRGRGLGRQLLQTALHWSFEVRKLPQAALCVTEWRDDARRLYERAGFRLHATGRGARRRFR
jgi:ribosomal protein S18 acetylase RimI-like enzyme